MAVPCASAVGRLPIPLSDCCPPVNRFLPFQCTRQIISEKLGRGSRTVDLELEAQIDILRDNKKKYENILRLAQTLSAQLFQMVHTQRQLGDAFADLSLKSLELHVRSFPYRWEGGADVVESAATPPWNWNLGVLFNGIPPGFEEAPGRCPQTGPLFPGEGFSGGCRREPGVLGREPGRAGVRDSQAKQDSGDCACVHLY